MTHNKPSPGSRQGSTRKTTDTSTVETKPNSSLHKDEDLQSGTSSNRKNNQLVGKMQHKKEHKGRKSSVSSNGPHSVACDDFEGYANVSHTSTEVDNSGTQNHEALNHSSVSETSNQIDAQWNDWLNNNPSLYNSITNFDASDHSMSTAPTEYPYPTEVPLDMAQNTSGFDTPNYGGFTYESQPSINLAPGPWLAERMTSWGEDFSGVGSHFTEEMELDTRL